MKKIIFLVSVIGLSFLLVPANAQDIVFTLDNDSLKYGLPGELITIYGTISNTSGNAINVYLKRVEENVPAGWQTYYCTDVCLPPNISTYTLNVAAGYDQIFYFDFMTDAIADSGNALMRFTNQSTPSNTMEQRLYGITDSAYTGIGDPQSGKRQVIVYPNPLINNGWLTVQLGSGLLASGQSCELLFYDAAGRLVGTTPNISAQLSVIDVGGFSPGIYIYRLVSDENSKMLTQGKLVIQR